MRFLWLASFFFMVVGLKAQSFEVSPFQEIYRTTIGETLRVPVKLKNTSDKTITLILRKTAGQLGGTQKNYYCFDNVCLDQKVEDYVVKLEPQQTLSGLQIALDAGLAHGASSAHYLVINRSNPSESIEFDLNFVVEERSRKNDIYSSAHITLHDVYPNPVTEHAFVDYKVLDSQIEAKIIIHNLLGNPIGEYDLPSLENKVKISADALSAGIYFYTLYLDNEGVVTRKLIVKK